MTPWEAAKKRDPAMSNWLIANGWTAARYNALQPWQQTELRVKMKGGLDEASFFELWGQAAIHQAQDYGAAIGGAATAAARGVRNIAVLGLVGAGLVALIVYRKPLLQLMGMVKR